MPAYRFGPFLLDTARRELLRDGAAVELPPKAFDVIVYLLEHRERAVGRDELIAGVWGRVDVSDNVLDQIVLRARKALGDVGEPRRCIATRPRFGFAWVAEVELVEQHARPAVAGEPVRAARRKWPLAAALSALAILAIGMVAWWTQRDAAAPAVRDAILVLPLDVAPESDAGWARLGLMDLVAQRLRETGFDTLPSDHAVALLRGVPAAPRDAAALRTLGEHAGAAYIVAGEVAFASGQWQVRLRAFGPRETAAEAGGEAAQPLDAARRAADALASALGRVPSGIALPGDPALALQLQQIDAAVLGDDLDTAQRLLDSMTPVQREEPATRLRAATLHFRRGDLDAASQRFEALLADVSASDDPRLRGTVLNALGNLSLRRGDTAGAERRGEEAIALLSTLSPTRELGRAWTGRAIARSTQQRHEEALADFARARVVLDGIDDRLGVARVDINVGILEAHRGRYAEAVPLLAAAADRLAVFNDLTNELYARVALARCRLGLLEPAAALADARRLGELVTREPNPERRRYANLARVEALAANGRDTEAAALLQAVREEAGADADVVLLGWAHALAARQTLAADPGQAEREAEAALNAPWEEEGSRFFAEAWLTLVRARLALAAGEEGIAAALQGFENWAARKNDPAIEPALTLARAEVVASHDPAAAGPAYERALAAAAASRIPAEWLLAAERQATWLLSRGKAEQASAVAGRATAWAERDFGAALLAARLHAALGQTQAAQAALAQARRLAGERRVPSLDELANG
jgi:DNA-binding winged helix-turn-helix (wHTH) protein